MVSAAGTFVSKCAPKRSLLIPSHLQRVATLRCEIGIQISFVPTAVTACTATAEKNTNALKIL